MADIKREIQDLHQNLSTLVSSQIDLAEDVDISQFRHLVNQTFESFDLRIEDLSYQVSNVSATLENLTSLLDERMNDLSSHILNDTFNLLQSYNSHVNELGLQVSALSVAHNSSMQSFKAFEGDILEQVNNVRSTLSQVKKDLSHQIATKVDQIEEDMSDVYRDLLLKHNKDVTKLMTKLSGGVMTLSSYTLTTILTFSTTNMVWCMF